MITEALSSGDTGRGTEVHRYKRGYEMGHGLALENRQL